MQKSNRQCIIKDEGIMLKSNVQCTIHDKGVRRKFEGYSDDLICALHCM